MLIRRLLTYSILSLVALGGFFGSVHIETANQGNNIISVSYEGNGVYAEPNGCRTPEECNATNTAANTSSTEMTKMLNSLLSGLNIIL